MNETPASESHRLIVCPECERQVPDAPFCGACGAHLATEVGNSVHRHHSFAADPSQHVLHPSIVTTLFPHLPHRRRLPFQLALGIATIALIVLALLRWTGPAVALASFTIPLVYLLQLWEVEVYEDEPFLVIGVTLVLGAILGAVWAELTGSNITHLLLQNATLGVNGSRLLQGAILYPLGAQVLMLVGGVAMYFRSRYAEALDGFTFGVAGALGFMAASTLVNLIPELREGLVSNATAWDSVLDALQRGVLAPVISASLAGLVCGSLWLSRAPTRRLPGQWLFVGLGPVIVLTVVARVLLGLESVTLTDLLSAVAANTLAAIVLIVWVRVAVHYMLLAEAAEVTIGPDMPCSHCHHIVPRMAFCPNCGIATRATPKSGSGRAHRVAAQGAV